MFQQLVPLLRQRSVLLTVTSLEEDQIRVNVLPKEAGGRRKRCPHHPDELHRNRRRARRATARCNCQLCLELKNTLGRAKEGMAAAAKAAEDEARNKSKTVKKAAPAEAPVKKEQQKAAEPPKASSLFDMPAPVGASPTPLAASDESHFIFVVGLNVIQDQRALSRVA